MKYVVEIAGRQIEVVVDGHAILVDGTPYEATLDEVHGTPLAALRLGEAVHTLTAARGTERGRWVVRLGGWRHEVEALDERTRAIRELTRASRPSGPAPLTAPMPGLIVRVNVQPGDAVAAGQGLVLMEAMKMENELRAAAAGTVRAVHATPGTAVEKGALLVELE